MNTITIELNFEDGVIVGDYKITDSEIDETTTGLANDGSLGFILDNALNMPADCKLEKHGENLYHGRCNDGIDTISISYYADENIIKFKHHIVKDDGIIVVIGNGFSSKDYKNLQEMLNQFT